MTVFKALLKVLVFGGIVLFFAGCENAALVASYTLSFNGNGANGGNGPANIVISGGQYATVPGRGTPNGGLVKTGYYFKNWNTSPGGTGMTVRPGQSVQLNSDTVLYAQWELGSADKTFWVRDLSDNWYTIEAKKLGEGDKCIVYGDILESDAATTENAASVVAQYETSSGIYDKITGTFGDIKDVDSNGKVIFLLLDIIDGYDPGAPDGGYVAGYFDPIHMYINSSYSNRADMLFLDVNPGEPDYTNQESKTFYSTIAHELQHLINFSQTAAASPPKAEKDIWINEGLSTGAEAIYDPLDKSRIDYFNNDPVSTIAYGNNFFVWDGYWEQEYGDVLADYSTAYLFFQWLRIHANGTEIYKDIIAHQSGDFNAVLASAKLKISSITSSWTWGDLLRTWMIANAKNASTGLEGYKTELPLSPTVWSMRAGSRGGKSWAFSPGEGIFSEGSTLPGSNSGNIEYQQITGSSYSFVAGSPPYTSRSLVLTYNVNTNYRGSDESGYLTSVQDSASRSAGNYSPPIKAPPQGPYPVSFGDKAAGLDRPAGGRTGRGVAIPGDKTKQVN
ncbi:hypothetical protein AGMMS50293_06490 [Spirochaetia bacterium]|nr:hypothetical protein AGMMS50293_06490 [Spirochaetia bacterium]